MKVMCINGYENLLIDGDIYTVVEVTKKGNFLLEEVEAPEGFTSFNSDRFIPVQDTEDNWTEEMEDTFWSEQPSNL
jgi:hypothetical protein